MTDSITPLPAAVAAQGALPVPVGDQPQPLDDEPGHLGRGEAARFCVACHRTVAERLSDPTTKPVVVCPGDDPTPATDRAEEA